MSPLCGLRFGASGRWLGLDISELKVPENLSYDLLIFDHSF